MWRAADDSYDGFFFDGVLEAEAFDDEADLALVLVVDFEALDFDALAVVVGRFFVVVCLRGRRTGLFQSTALSARNVDGITIGPSA